MKKKVALFGNAWGYEYFQMILRGVKQYASNHLVDVDIFVTYSTDNMPQEEKNGEMNLFHLPDLKQYDAAIVLANSLNIEAEKQYLQKQLVEIGIPAVCLEYELPGLAYMGSENYSGMYELAEHLFRDHGYKDIIYIGGPREHSEAAERLKAVSDAARECGVSLDKERIFYGDWSYRGAYSAVSAYFSKYGKYPEAIICANDMMALGLMEYLLAAGCIPGVDVVVTGFDSLQRGALEKPTLTTVGRNWKSMGIRAMEMVLDEEWSYEKYKRVILKSELVKRESCGCSLKNHDTLKAKVDMIYETQEMGYIDGVELDIHMRSLYSSIHGCRTASSLHAMFSQYIVREGNFYEHDAFTLCLNPHFFEEEIASEYYDVRNLDKMISVGNVYNGKIYDIEEVVFPNLLPQCFQDEEQSNVFFYVPLHLDGFFAGYAVMRAYEFQLNNAAMFVWSRHVMQYLQQIRQNVQIDALTNRLRMLSATDGLTGLYNRRGCDELAKPYYDMSRVEGAGMAVVMCDVDDMKEINDVFGHLQGDFAICTLANAIKDSVDDAWYACRYGGDEFIIIGKCDNEEEMKSIFQEIEKNVQLRIQQSKAPFDLRVSVGGVMIHSDDDLSFETAIKLADDKMYRIKSKHKQESGGEVR